ncbi:MAG: YcbK family protein [Flammeovirgaceae bacterium]
MTEWRWKYFRPDEIRCKGDGSLVINEDALNKLEKMREIMGAPLKINSAYRSPAYNKKIGGASNSMHLQGRAFDVSNVGHNPARLYKAAIDAGFSGVGFYRTFLHVDTGNKRWWGNYRKLYTDKPFVNSPAPKPIVKPNDYSDALNYNDGFNTKETELPNKIEGVKLSDNQKVAVATTSVAATGVAATGGIATAITDPQIITSALSFLQNVDWRVALVVIFVLGLGGLIWWLWKRK